jgi:hypothetical protein
MLKYSIFFALLIRQQIRSGCLGLRGNFFAMINETLSS